MAHDARPHLPGALLLDLSQVATHDFPRDRAIVIYCACPNEESARRAAQVLVNRGYRDVRPLVGGLDRWMHEGLPVEAPLADAMAA